MVRVRLRAAYACTMLCGASGFPAVPTAPAVSRSARVLSLAAGHSPAEGEGKGPHTIYFKGEEIVAEHGETLRSALLQGKVTPHNGRAQLINCRGLGTCGTCAVQLEGQVYPESWNARERLRLNFPPHKPPNNERLRLACQVRVEGDLHVTKYDRFWGEGDTETSDKSFSVPFGELEYLLDASKK